MSKQILAIVSSPRKNGNSELLVDEFIKGATEAGHTTEKLCLREKKIAPCIACEVCLRNGGTCVQKDDMAGILQKIIEADVLVLSTPVYYYSISAQLKMMIDRTLAGGGKLMKKEFYFIATAADGAQAMEHTMADMQGFVDCVPDSIVKGKVYGQAFGIGEIQGKNTGIVPQYYVEGSHEAIIPRDLYMQVQEEMVRRANLHSGSERKKRVYSSKYALSSIVYCPKCGDIYRRIAWNNRGKHSTVWRCCTRVEHGPKACDAPTIQESDLQNAVARAINDVLYNLHLSKVVFGNKMNLIR